MYDKEIEYYNFTIKAFNYLNGMVNTFNRNCGLEIDLWTNYTLRDINIAGDYGYPGLVTVYLRAIIASITKDNINESEYQTDRMIRCNIIYVITHELLHADQSYDVLRYNKDPEYAYNVEKDVIISSIAFISSMIPELSTAFGFDVEAIDYPHPTYAKLTNTYSRLSSRRDDYAKFMSAIVVRLGVIKDDQKSLETISQLYSSFMEWIDEYDNVIIFANGGSIVIKCNGVFLDNTVPFNVFIYNYIFRFHRYVYMHIDSSSLSDLDIPYDKDDAPCLAITITNRINTISPDYPEGN